MNEKDLRQACLDNLQVIGYPIDMSNPNFKHFFEAYCWFNYYKYFKHRFDLNSEEDKFLLVKLIKYHTVHYNGNQKEVKIESLDEFWKISFQETMYILADCMIHHKFV